MKFLILLLFVVFTLQSNPIQCEFVIVGGSTSAVSAALSAAETGVSVCLIEPTNWPGGQITMEGVPAIDFAHHTIKEGENQYQVWKYGRQKENISPSFYQIYTKVGNPGKCWVSLFCFLPIDFVKELDSLLEQRKVKVFRNSVLKKVYMKDSNTIQGIEVIERITKSCPDLLSKDLPLWYSRDNIPGKYDKKIHQIFGKVFMEGSAFGDLLVLSDSNWIQGIEYFNETCGQSFTYGFAEKLFENDINEPDESPYPLPDGAKEFYSLEKFTWESVFRYRRLLGKIGNNVSFGDITLQNWGKGNDNVFSYLFLSRNQTLQQVRDWNGGVSYQALDFGERLAFGWHFAYKKMNSTYQRKLGLVKDIMGTCHGLSQMPYLRDTRRSIGIDNFMIKIQDISGRIANVTGRAFEDRVAIGLYNVDIHPVRTCKYPEYVYRYYPILPFFIPFRALTNSKVKNLLVGGRSMAQDFLTNSATRLHPIEWSSGISVGISASFMIKHEILDTKIIYEKNMRDLQKEISKFTPICWNIENKTYPLNSFC